MFSGVEAMKPAALADTATGDSGLEAIAGLTNLEDLDLADTRTGRNVTPHYQRAFDLLTTRRAQAISKVVFGKSADGGGTWQTRVDATVPYSAKFSAEPGKTVIFRARAIAEDGKQSIYAANMIHTQAMPAKK